MSAARSVPAWILRFTVLFLLFIVFFVAGAMIVGSAMPASASTEPGLVSETGGLMNIALANVGIIGSLILSSRLNGWRLALSISLSYYGAVTFLMQIETWYFLSSITVSPELLPRLFLMGLPTAFLFIPSAVWILGKWRETPDPVRITQPVVPVTQWVWKVAVIVLSYLVLYFGAGYFIAWQNPDLRAFYGHPGDALGFWEQMMSTIRHEPSLIPFQVLRALLWTLCALPVIYGSKLNVWWTALLLGLFFSVPQNIGHIIANPLMPNASVRLSHMIETASSTFVFGTIVVWLLHRRDDLRDLFDIREG